MKLAGPVDDTAVPDLDLALSEPQLIPTERPSTEVIAERVANGHVWYTFAHVADHVVARFYGIVDFEISPDCSDVVCIPDKRSNASYASILASGALVAYIHAMKGRSVLHASAVEVDEAAVAFVGPSGRGKSTMAALQCADGRPVVTDDVLALEISRTAIFCIRGSNELRLRQKAASMIGRFSDDTAVRVTADERHAVAPVYSTFDRLPLAAIIFPYPSRDQHQVTARRIDVTEAALLLGQCHRIEGWQEPSRLRDQFLQVTEVLRRVPVYEVVVPWGPPFGLNLAQDTLRVCGLLPPSASDPDQPGLKRREPSS